MEYYESIGNKDATIYKLKNKQRPEWEDGPELHGVFSVRIDTLKFNANNGRIATFISQYNSDSSKTPLDKLTTEEFNDVIGKYIVDSHTSLDTYKKTKNDMRIKGQIRPGLILEDGTVISGNRRFQILRELYNETHSERYRYFDCFIIPNPTSDEGKIEIKKLELKTQNGLNEKVDYNPIDKLVSMRDALFGPNKMSISNYSEMFNMKKSVVEDYYYRVKVMDDYLRFLGKEGCYYLIRADKLDGPINEVAKTYKKLEKSENLQEWAKIRVLFYIGFKEKGDTTRIVRDYKSLYENHPDNFNELLRTAEKNLEENTNNNTTAPKEDLIKSTAMNTNFRQKSNDIVVKSKLETTKDMPIKSLDLAFNKICSIDTDQLAYLNESSKQIFKKKVDDIFSKLNSFVSILKD